MNRRGILCSILFFSLLAMMGCWDIREPNQRAFLIATGMDRSKDGNLQVSCQFAIPSEFGTGNEKGGGKKKSLVVTGTGKSLADAMQKIQSKLPREIFIGHRQAFFIGEQIAWNGFGNMLDEYIRNPASELRSNIYLVRGTALDFLQKEYSFEQASGFSANYQSKINGYQNVSLRDFLADANTQGLDPVMPVIDMNQTSFKSDPSSQKENKQFRIHETAIFNKKFKMAGILADEESFYINWIAGKQNRVTLTKYISKNGTVSLDLQNLSRKIDTTIQGNRIKAVVYLNGKGIIRENNTELDPTQSRDVKIIEDEFNLSTLEAVQRMAVKVQNQYQVDIFGIGEEIHHRSPAKWKTMAANWDQSFSQVDLSIKVNLSIMRSGRTNSKL